MSHIGKLLLSAVLVLTSFVAPLAAQVGTQASILGVVNDASKGAMPGATITATNLATGLTQTAVSDESGNFEILALPIGWYSVTVSMQGFKTWKVDRVELTVGDRRRVSPVLEVGAVTEEVSVEGGTSLLQTERSSVTTVIQMQQIRELPLSTRNAVALVNLVPGVRQGGDTGPERGATVQGMGLRGTQTEFQLDGLNANAAMDEGGITIPNVDTIAEFSVETSSFSAENGRNPLQVIVATKSGTNALSGSFWEFFQHDGLNARNTFATTVPKLRRNQFGGAMGGPVIRNRTFFFASFEGTPIDRETIFNSVVPTDAMRSGDFSGLGRAIRDPLTGQPFPGNIIPQDRISSASKFFLPYVLQQNEPGRFRAVAPTENNTYQYTARLDHQLTQRQRIYGRWVMNDNESEGPGYTPDQRFSDATTQHNIGVNYTYTITPSTLLTATVGYLKSDNKFTSDTWLTSGQNLLEQAGIRGIPTAGREDFLGPPNVNITGYQAGFGSPAFGVPGRLWSDVWNAKVSVTSVRGTHSLSAGYERNDRSVYARHGSHSPRGSFDFNAQYTGDGFADFLLGLTSGTRRNYPLETFGLESSPYTGAFVQDFWRVRSDLTISLGLRFERWSEKKLVNGNGATFDPAIGKVIAGVDENGQINLTGQPISPFLAAATQGLWVPATEVGIPNGLYEADNRFGPRIGATWRPQAVNDLVVRGGYGTYYSSFTGNRSASSIVGLPYWTWESLSYSSLTLQRWETAWPENPQSFIQPSVGEAPDWNIDAVKTHEFNVSVQKGLPWQSALTVSYVGTRLDGQVSLNPYNEVAPGAYTNLQAAKPYPLFGEINVLENLGKSWYDALQLKWERRFADGFSFTGSYSLSKNTVDTIPSAETDRVVPFAPAGYQKGRGPQDRRHILVINAIYELPIGRDRKYLSDLNPILNGILGGWQLSGINSFVSGVPLTLTMPGATLGNGWNTRPNLVGDPDVDSPSANGWFNTAAFAAPAQYQYGDSGLGIIEGPAAHILDLGLSKNFEVVPGKRLQVRWEMFNALNKVNLGNPGTTFGSANFGRILSAGGARTMQLGVKFVF
jgi:carboxypeptidase family protein